MNRHPETTEIPDYGSTPESSMDADSKLKSNRSICRLSPVAELLNAPATAEDQRYYDRMDLSSTQRLLRPNKIPSAKPAPAAMAIDLYGFFRT